MQVLEAIETSGGGDRCEAARRELARERHRDAGQHRSGVVRGGPDDVTGRGLGNGGTGNEH